MVSLRILDNIGIIKMSNGRMVKAPNYDSEGSGFSENEFGSKRIY